MRVAGGVIVALSFAALPAVAALNSLESGAGPDAASPPSGQSIHIAAAKKKTEATPKKTDPAPKKGALAPQAISGDKIGTLAERVNIQFDLAWSGDFIGLVNGEWADKSTAAVKAFQKRNGFKETGVLAPNERTLLASSSKTKQERVGWRMVDDRITGALVGLPTKQVPNVTTVKDGTRWSSAQGQVQVGTFRVREPGTTLSSVYEQQKKEPQSRHLEVNALRADSFFLVGMQGLKKFYVRAEIKDDEVRGITVLYDQATEGLMDAVAVATAGAFEPFPGTGVASLIGPAPRRKVEYGTGVVLTPAGHILTDAQTTDDCGVIEVGQYGAAERVAKDRESGLALLRLYGAANLVPAALVNEGAKGADVTLVGIGDPQLQGGSNAVTTMTAHIGSDGITPAPPLGFAGAAALDAQGHFLGMVALKSAMVASNGPAVAPTSGIVGVDDIRKFLDTQYVTPATGRTGVDAAKASVVRVICVRR